MEIFYALRAERMSILIKCDISRGIFPGFIPAVDIDERIDIPPFQQFIGWDVVMCRVKAYGFWRNAKDITSEIIYGIKNGKIKSIRNDTTNVRGLSFTAFLSERKLDELKICIVQLGLVLVAFHGELGSLFY